MNERIRIVAVMICLAFTCFLTQCQGCRKTDPVTQRVLPDQPVLTFSYGFPFPFFDIDILSSSGDMYRYALRDSYRTGISVGVNLLFAALAALFMIFLSSKKIVNPNRLAIVIMSLFLLFNAGLLVPYYPSFVLEALMLLYVHPVGFISEGLDLLGIDLLDNNVAPRVYLVLLIILLYCISSLGSIVKRRMRG